MKIDKYRKYHKIKNILKNEKINTAKIVKGFYGLKLLESGVLTEKQLESMRRIITRITKRVAKIIINVRFNHPLTKKPLLSRMGKGAGGIDSWICYVKKGKVVFELSGISQETAITALNLVKNRISLKTKTIVREVSDF